MPEAKRRVLLVDDEPSILKTVGKHLESAGFQVVEAIDGEEALQKARAEQPDVIVLDLMLPRHGGLEVSVALRKEPQFQHTPIIFFTGRGQEDVVASLGTNEKLLHKWGANAYVPKVDGAVGLIRQIKKLLPQA